MKLGCLFFPQFAIQVERAHDASLRGKVVVIGGSSHERKPVHDASPEALECGVRRGISLREAYSLCPHGLFLPLSSEKYARAFTAILTLLADSSPVVEAGASDSAFIGLRYEPDGQALMREISRLIEEQLQFRTSMAVAANKFVAWVASRVAATGQIIAVHETEERSFLKDVPVSLLPASPQTLGQLELLGIRRMGQLAELPLAALVLEFGGEAKQLWELSNGIDESGLIPWNAPTLKEHIRFAPPADSLSQLLAGADAALINLTGQLKRRWQCCRCLTMSLSFENGHIIQRVFHFKEAISSEQMMLHHIRRCLEEARFTAPVSVMRLTLADFCSESGRQALFIDEPLKRRGRLASTIAHLQQRYGPGVIKKVLPTPHAVLPEESLSFIDFGS